MRESFQRLVDIPILIDENKQQQVCSFFIKKRNILFNLNKGGIRCINYPIIRK